MKYGDDRLFLDVRDCRACGGDHPEQEFKRQVDGTYAARCPRMKTWVVLPAQEVIGRAGSTQ